MRNFKKVIAAGLALLMLALSVNVSFAAEEYTEKEAIVVAKVNAAAIMQGTDKGFEPAKTLTRAEAAAIMVRMKGISESTVKQNAGTTLFTDVAASHWAAGYVNVASNYGIIKGVGANMFAPEKEVTVAEFYTMAARALNAGAVAEAEGTWPTNYVNFAIENKLAEDVTQIYTAAATRMTAAQIVVNTLTANMWKKGSVKNGEITWDEDTTKNILTGTLNIVELKGTISSANTKKLKATLAVGVEAYNGEKDFAERADLGKAKENITYTIWYDTKEKEVVGFWLPDETDSVSFTDVKGLNKAGDRIKLVVDGEETEYKMAASNVVIEINGTDIKTAASGSTPAVKFTFGDLTEDKEAAMFGVAYFDSEGKTLQKVYATKYSSYGVVEEVKNNKLYMEDFSKTRTTITFKLEDDDNEVYHITRDGKAIESKDIEEGDAIFYYVDGNDWYINVYNETVEGKIKSMDGKTAGKKVKIDGTSYELGREFNDLAAGNEGTFYLAENGRIVMYNLEKKETKFAAIGAIKLTYTNDQNGEVSVKLATFDGELTEWMGIHKDSRLTSNATSNATLIDELKKITNSKNYDSLGMLVKYEIKGDEVKLLPADAKSMTEFKTNGNKADSVVAGSEYYLTSTTKVGELKSNDKETYKEEVTIKVVDVDDLDDTTAAAQSTQANPVTRLGYVADVDGKEVGIVLFDAERTDIAEDNTWAFVISENAAYEDDDNDKLTISYKIAYSENGETKTKTIYGKEDETLKGKVVSFALDDEDVIENYKELEATTDGVANRVYVKEITKDYVTFIKDCTDTTPEDDEFDNESNRFFIAEDLVVISSDNSTVADAEYKVSDLSSIENVVTKPSDGISADWNVVAAIFEDENEDDDNEIVVIIYYTDDAEI